MSAYQARHPCLYASSLLQGIVKIALQHFARAFSISRGTLSRGMCRLGDGGRAGL